MLHRIAPFEDKLSPNEAMKVSPEFLESFITQALDLNFHFISLDRLYDGLMHNDLPEYFICFTIDDGYKDNLTFGYPIFAKYDIPFCIYICTSFPESSHNMWWFALEDYLLEHDSISYHNTKYDIATKALKEEMFLTIRAEIIAQINDYESCKQTLENLDISYNPRVYDNLTLSWDDIHFLHTQKLQNVMGGGAETTLHHRLPHPLTPNF